MPRDLQHPEIELGSWASAHGDAGAVHPEWSGGRRHAEAFEMRVPRYGRETGRLGIQEFVNKKLFRTLYA
jgi:hypothetical protein